MDGMTWQKWARWITRAVAPQHTGGFGDEQHTARVQRESANSISASLSLETAPRPGPASTLGWAAVRSWGRLAGLWPGGGPVRCHCRLRPRFLQRPESSITNYWYCADRVDGQSQLRAVQLRAVQLNSCRNYESHGPRALGPCAPCAPAVPPTACMRPVRYVHTLKGYH